MNIAVQWCCRNALSANGLARSSGLLNNVEICQRRSCKKYQYSIPTHLFLVTRPSSPTTPVVSGIITLPQFLLFHKSSKSLNSIFSSVLISAPFSHFVPISSMRSLIQKMNLISYGATGSKIPIQNAQVFQFSASLGSGSCDVKMVVVRRRTAKMRDEVCRYSRPHVTV